MSDLAGTVDEMLRSLTPGARRDLLRVLTSASDVRADVIRQFYERPVGKDMAELLVELELEEWKRQLVIERLRGGRLEGRRA